MKTLLLTSFLVLTACETPSYLPKSIQHLASLDFSSAIDFCQYKDGASRSYYIGYYGRNETIHCGDTEVIQTGTIAYVAPMTDVKFVVPQGVKPKKYSDLIPYMKPVYEAPKDTFEAPLEEGNCKEGFCQLPIFSLEMSEGQGLCFHMGLYGWKQGSKYPSFQYMIKTKCLGV